MASRVKPSKIARTAVKRGNSMAVLRSYYWLCALPGDVGGVGGVGRVGGISRISGSASGSLGAAAEPKGGLLTLGPHLLARYTVVYFTAYGYLFLNVDIKI